jgi:hypothetical protein
MSIHFKFVSGNIIWQYEFNTQLIYISCMRDKVNQEAYQSCTYVNIAGDNPSQIDVSKGFVCVKRTPMKHVIGDTTIFLQVGCCK